jgi:Sec-independent protein translocase protein TatA
MFGAIGMPELFIVSVIALMVVNPANFPDLGKSLGTAIRGLKKAINRLDKFVFENPRLQRHSITLPDCS